MASEYLTFIKQLKGRFTEIGSVVPSSPALARAMVRPIRESAKESLHILEVGPGTGPFTRRILKLMGATDQLVICEINPTFMARLKRELQSNKYYQLHKSRVTFFEGPVQDLAHSRKFEKFDVIVSSLPFSNFPAQLVHEILGLLEGMLVPDGAISFCEYVGMRKLARLLPERRDKARAIDAVIDGWCDRVNLSGRVNKELSILNVPPAFAIRFNYDRNGINGAHRKNGTNGHAIGHTNGHAKHGHRKGVRRGSRVNGAAQ